MPLLKTPEKSSAIEPDLSPAMRAGDIPITPKPRLLEFFAGSGLVTEALAPFFKVAWANDISAKKAHVYRSNHGDGHFHLGSIADVSGQDLPAAQITWSSFPCQDLSHAGNGGGINAKRSGLVWQWLRIIDEMPEKPAVLAAENVLGLVSRDSGAHYHALHDALTQRGYRAGAMLIDAVHFLPQSRPRIFVVAIKNNIAIPASLTTDAPNWAHNTAIRKVAKSLPDWIWWNLPEPPRRNTTLADMIDWAAPCDDQAMLDTRMTLLPPAHLAKLATHATLVAPGYRRTRPRGQTLELRFDGNAGCLRTPGGGSSRQILMLKQGDILKTRLLTARETARLMGAPDSYILPAAYNDAYHAMGDAVAIPVARWLGEHLLLPLAQSCGRGI